ncbi:MAG TPA: hypothetical protein GYA07_05575, partial [Verrucomicrobia bacterium]|nr:hypothetical protein [Verrucomicrobiota bacterium]
SAVVTENLKFVYDGWKCLAELNATNNALVRHYAWGLDLSGTMDEAGLPRQSTATAGGVGGLLWMRSGPAVYFCEYDGNGNVVGLVQGNGAQVAVYEYDPFGRTLRATGSQAKNNPFRFSTKRTENSTDLVMYEYRLYNPSTGRWKSRDAVAEKDLANLYCFVGNDPILGFDRYGRERGGAVICPRCHRMFTLGGTSAFVCPYCGYGSTPPPNGVVFEGCDFNSGQNADIADVLGRASRNLQRVSDGTLKLPPNLTEDYASCLADRLMSYTVSCTPLCAPVCLIFDVDGITWPGSRKTFLCGYRLRKDPGDGIGLLTLHEMVHSCGK